jgi:hypothetical protein
MRLANKVTITCWVGLSLTQILPVFADTETTTVKTTTVTRDVLPSGAVAPLILPATTSYILVDPITGATKGVYNPNGTAVETRELVPGQVVIDQATGRIVATVNASGQTVDVISAPAFDPLVSSIDLKQSQLTTMINTAQSNGSIDAVRASALRAQLEKVAADEIAYKQDGALTYSEALSLATRLNDLQDQLVLVGRLPAVTPILGPKFMTVDGKVVMVLDDLDLRRMKLGQRVDVEYLAGRLSSSQVNSLKELLDSAAALESKYKKNGEISPSKKEKVSVKLNRVESDLNKDVAIINSKRAKIGIRVE